MANAQSTNAAMTREDLERELDELRTQRQALAFELREGRGRAEDLELVEDRIGHVALQIERLELAEIEAEARARAEAARQDAERRRALIGEVRALEQARAETVAAIERTWAALEPDLWRLLENGRALYGKVAEVRANDGEELSSSEWKLSMKEQLAKWLAWRIGSMCRPFVERPGSHTWSGPLADMLYPVKVKEVEDA